MCGRPSHTCCAESVETCPILLDTIRSSESATSCARKEPHMAIDAARDSARRMMPIRAPTERPPGTESSTASTTSQNPSS
eukprot:scaffold85853_cov32-Tisochrysis_lutea.AAC.3